MILIWLLSQQGDRPLVTGQSSDLIALVLTTQQICESLSQIGTTKRYPFEPKTCHNFMIYVFENCFQNSLMAK
jgi:hypothetical protein